MKMFSDEIMVSCVKYGELAVAWQSRNFHFLKAFKIRSHFWASWKNLLIANWTHSCQLSPDSNWQMNSTQSINLAFLKSSRNGLSMNLINMNLNHSFMFSIEASASRSTIFSRTCCCVKWKIQIEICANESFYMPNWGKIKRLES